jgi:hypothetical protein
LFSDSLKQLPDFFYLVAFGLFAWVRAMAAPLLSLDAYFHARAFPLMHLRSQAATRLRVVALGRTAKLRSTSKRSAALILD